MPSGYHQIFQSILFNQIYFNVFLISRMIITSQIDIFPYNINIDLQPHNDNDGVQIREFTLTLCYHITRCSSSSIFSISLFLSLPISLIIIHKSESSFLAEQSMHSRFLFLTVESTASSNIARLAFLSKFAITLFFSWISSSKECLSCLSLHLSSLYLWFSFSS